MEELASARRHPAALASIVIAGLAVAALALVTLAYLVGWIPMRGVLPAGPGSIATPGQQLGGTVVGGVDLLPGETLVVPAEAPSPPAPAAAPPPRPARGYCANCGTVASIGSAGSGWEVRVRFEDGRAESVRYPDRPRLRIGERVHLDDGRLVPE